MTAPAALRVPCSVAAGQAVALVSPAGAVAPERITGAAGALRQWGLRGVESAHCRGRYGAFGGVINYSGTQAERLADFNWALRSPEVRAIVCNRGGYGAVRLIDSLDYAAIAADPKWLVGFSDVSALHAAMHHAGVMSLHAPMAKHLTEHGTEGEVSGWVHSIVTGGPWPDYSLPPSPANRIGTVTAQLTGGNLAVLSALVPTDFNLLKPGNILFVEDIGESVYRVERMLHSLRLAGILPRLAGLLVGQFTNYLDNAQGTAMRHMVEQMVAPYAYPVAFDFPVGHVDRNLPLVEGAETTLAVTAGGVRLVQHRPF